MFLYIAAYLLQLKANQLIKVRLPKLNSSVNLICGEAKLTEIIVLTIRISVSKPSPATGHSHYIQCILRRDELSSHKFEYSH